jgi:hypothetical protein
MFAVAILAERRLSRSTTYDVPDLARDKPPATPPARFPAHNPGQSSALAPRLAVGPEEAGDPPHSGPRFERRFMVSGVPAVSVSGFHAT